MDFLLISATFCVLLVSFFKTGFLPFPTALIIIILTSQIMFCLTHAGVITNSLYVVANLGGLQAQYLYTQVVYFAIAFFSFLSMYGASRNIDLNRIQDEVKELVLKTNASRKILNWLLILVLVHLVLFFLVADWQTLWFHTAYLAPLANGIADSDTIGLVNLVIKITIFMYVITIFGLFLAMNLNRPLMKMLFFVMASFYYIFFFGEHSRFATIFPILLALFSFVLKIKHRKIIIPGLLLFSLFTYGCALTGRGSFHHGFSSIFMTTSDFFGGDIGSAMQMILANITEGIFEISEGLQIKATYDSLYKITAFSPLPSIIDGYNTAHQVRIHLYVPMPGLTEIIDFGVGYVMFGIILFYIIIRSHNALITKNFGLFMMCNFLIMFSIYHMLAYPLRNAMHFAWIAFAISIFTARRKRQTSGVTPSKHEPRRPLFGMNKPALSDGPRSAPQ